MFKMCFDLIISRFANWKPPIVLPEQLLLFFALRGLPDDTFGPTKNIILTTENISLTRGFQLLRDAGGSGVALINSTLGSGEQIPSTPEAGTVLAVTPPAPKSQSKTAAEKAADRERRKTALCKKEGPCKHHGPKSLHATSECRDPQLLKRRKKKSERDPKPALALAPVPPQATTMGAPYPAIPAVYRTHHAPMYPPMMYSPQMLHPMQPYMQYPQNQQLSGEPQVSHTLVITVVEPEDNAYDADTEDDERYHSQDHPHYGYDSDSSGPPDLTDISDSSSESWSDSDSEDSEDPPPLVDAVTRSTSTDDSESDREDSEGPPPLVDVIGTSTDDYSTSDTEDSDNEFVSDLPSLIHLSCESSSSDTDSDYDIPPPIPIEQFQEFSQFLFSDFSKSKSSKYHVANVPLQVLGSLISVYKHHDKCRTTPVKCSACSKQFHLDSWQTQCPYCNDTSWCYGNEAIADKHRILMLAPHDDSSTEDEPDDQSASAPAQHTVSGDTLATSSFNDDFEFLQHAARLADNAEAALDPEFAEYQRLAKAYAPRKAPPYVKACDRDIDRVGRGIVLDWMAEQRIIHNRDEFESRIDTPDSDQSETLEYNPSEHISKPKRFKGHGWSQKGTKASRAASRAKRKLIIAPCSPLPVSPARPRCMFAGCQRFTNKKQFGMGYFLYCFKHKHVQPNSPSCKPPKASSASSKSSPVPPTPMHVHLNDPPSSVQDITDHPSASQMSPEIRARSLDLTRQFPRLRRARAIYAYAEGLHTVLHYPRQFLVTLRGESALRNDSTVSPAIVFGPKDPQDAIRATLSGVSDPQVHPRSLCNHRGCIYSQGDLLIRRARHVAAIAAIDAMLKERKPQTQANVNLVTHSNPSEVILDTGAARHLHNIQQHFSSLRPCRPQQLAGFMGKSITISTCGTVGNFSDVLLLPSSKASVRSVGYALDRRGGSVTFTRTGASYTSPSGETTIIAVRNKIGLYSVIPGRMPAATSLVCISVPVQVRREAIHRLHQCLGHASLEKMRYIMKHAPYVCGSLTTRDLALFTTCPACKMGKSTKANRPKAAYSRSTIFGYRLHADTTGIIRPASTGGYKRALIVVDDASRWIFVVLLRTATMQETAAALRKVLYTVAADAHILRTQVIRTDNGTEFINSVVQSLFAQAGIRHERTCPNTSHQNGVAERAIGKLMPVVRTMIAAATALPTLWGEAIHAVAHVINRMSCSSNLNDHSPYQVRFGRAPDISHLQPWGITAYVRRMMHQSKVLPRADSGVLVGYGHEVTGQKGWRVHLPHNNKVVTSASVTFDRNLDESIQRRNNSLKSTSLPQQRNFITTCHHATDFCSPCSSTASCCPSPPPQQPAAEPIPPTHPVCTRASGPSPIQPSQIINGQTPPPQSPPVTRSTGGSWADVVRKADSDIQDANQPPFSRPRGRPPNNHKWDPQIGEYVPINLVTAAPTADKAWVFAVMQSDLVEDHTTPKSYEEAIRYAHWRKAIEEELTSLKDCAVWKAVVLSTLSHKAKAIPTKWVFKVKSDGHGKVARFKDRLVVCGYRQKFGRDYNLTFAPVAHATSIRMVFALAVSLRLCLRQFDIKTVFLYGELPKDQTVYLLPPKGVTVPPGHVLALQRCVYGLKQASLQWNRHLHVTLTKLRYQRTPFDPCVYHRHDDDGSFIFLAVVVDGIIVAATSASKLNEFYAQMSAVYNFKDLGEPKRLVDLNIQKLPNGLALDQNQFVKDIDKDFKQLDSKPVTTPIALGEVPDGASPLLPPGHRYLSLVGS